MEERYFRVSSPDDTIFMHGNCNHNTVVMHHLLLEKHASSILSTIPFMGCLETLAHCLG
jgi:hypothetical protein